MDLFIRLLFWVRARLVSAAERIAGLAALGVRGNQRHAQQDLAGEWAPLTRNPVHVATRHGSDGKPKDTLADWAWPGIGHVVSGVDCGVGQPVAQQRGRERDRIRSPFKGHSWGSKQLPRSYPYLTKVVADGFRGVVVRHGPNACVSMVDQGLRASSKSHFDQGWKRDRAGCTLRCSTVAKGPLRSARRAVARPG